MLRKSSELSIRDLHCIFVYIEMNLIALSGPINCVNMQYTALSGAMCTVLTSCYQESCHTISHTALTLKTLSSSLLNLVLKRKIDPNCL